MQHNLNLLILTDVITNHEPEHFCCCDIW